MRYSFLPNPEQVILKRRYRTRLSIVVLFLLSVAGLIGVGSLFPSYIYVYTEEQSQIKVATLLKKDQADAGITHLQDELQTDANKIHIILDTSTVAIPSDVIERIASVRGQTRITSITLGDIGTTTATVILGGVAPTRESLVAFKTHLEDLAVGNKVDLPISGFAKSKDIPFSLKVTYILP